MRWRPNAATVAVGRGPVAVALLERLLRGPHEGLRGVWAPGLVLVEGEPLPWVDGVEYLGTLPEAPALRVCTREGVSVPPDLLQAQVLATMQAGDAPVAVLAHALVPLGPARPLCVAAIERALRGVS
jgi:hypothetical protein